MAKNNKKLPQAILKSNQAIPIPATQSGGINDAAMATQAILSLNLVNPRDKIAIVPDAKAIIRSKIVGEVLDNISVVRTENGTIYAKIAPIDTLKNTLKNNKRNHFRYKLLFQVVIAKAIP